MAPAWEAVEAYLDALPAGVREQGRLLRSDLALLWSPTGRLEDLTTEPAHLPVLQTHALVADDLGLGARLIPLLTRYNLLALLLVHLQEGLCLRGSPFDRSWVGLAEELARSLGLLMVGSGLDPDAWTALHTAGWRRFQAETAGGTDVGSEEEALAAGGHRLAPFLLAPLSVAVAAGQEHRVTGMTEVLESLHEAASLRSDLLRMRDQLLQGRISPVVTWACREMGLHPDRSSAEAMAGATILSGVPRRLGEACDARLATGRSRALDLGFPGLADLVSRVHASLGEAVGVFDLEPRPAGTPVRRAAPSRPRRHLLCVSIEAARGYLLADRTFRDSWEVHRWGLAGAKEVTAVFPTGLVLEALARHGGPVGPLIDEFAASVRDRRLAYYDHPGLPHVETDTLGVLLRLYRWAGDPAGHARLIDRYLRLLDADHRDGIPVWLEDGDDTILLGEECGVIAAGVVAGLLDFDPQRRRGTIEAASRRILEGFCRRGPGISVNYPFAYTLAVVADLAARVRTAGLLEDLWDPVDETLGAWIDREAAQSPRPQRAASLVSACLRWGRRPARPEWIDVLLEGQRSDGRWAGEPLFFVPHRPRSVTWYASDLTTSALCYDALSAYRRSKAPGL